MKSRHNEFNSFSKKHFKKVVSFGFDTIELSNERMAYWEELYESWVSRDLELMKSNYINVKKEIQLTLNDNITLNEENNEYNFNIKLYKEAIQAISQQKSGKICDLINNNRMTVGKLNTFKEFKQFCRIRYKENIKQIVENKGWLKLLKFIKEKMRVEIYELEQELN